MRLVKSLLLLLGTYLIVCIVGGYFIVEGALHPPKKQLTQQAFQRAALAAKQLNASVKEVSIRANDGIILKAWHFDESRHSNKCVILFHGLGDNRKGMIGYVQLFLRNGYSVLTPDWRAHGESGGDLATYGIKEKSDVTSWINWLQSSAQSTQYYGLGESYGAAILLQSLQNEKRFSAVTAECSFATFREAAYDRGGQLIHTSDFAGRTIFFPAIEAAFWTASWKHNLDFDEISPLKTIAATKTPVLLIHGDMDNNIPVRHSRLMSAALQKNSNIQYWETHAGHSGTFGKVPDEFEKRVIGVFKIAGQIHPELR
jgi:uncharacterized protein